MQLDVKTAGLTMDQLIKSLARGQQGIEHVLSRMDSVIPKPRSGFKPTVPIIETMEMLAYNRMLLFKNGAQNAKVIEAETGVKVGEGGLEEIIRETL